MTVHDLIGLKTNRFDRYRRFYNRNIVFRLLYKIDHFITVSENTRKDLIENVRVDNKKITTIYEGTAERFKRRCLDEIPLEFRNKYNFPFLLYVGRVEHPNKNHINLVRAFRLLKTDPRFSRHRLVFAGKLATGSEYVLEEIRRTGLENDVVITGYLDDHEIPFLYNLALLKVYPSVYEGFGLPVLEGYRSGIPVVCSRSSSLLELSCSSDMLFDCYSPEDIFQKMRDFLVSNNIRDNQVMLQSKFLERFSWAKSAEETIAVYNSLINRP
jgi:glycosyltransferase involved in cell wall biosynthesis